MQKNIFCRIFQSASFCSLKISVFLLLLVFSAGHTLAIDNTPPAVLSTVPANGATGVAADLETIVITFTEPMNGNTNYNYSPIWGSHTFQWSEDKTQLTIIRDDAESPMENGKVIQINLNPYNPGSANFFEDFAGNRMPAYSFSFTIGQFNPAAPVVVSTSPSNGASNVSLNVSEYSVTFNMPMDYGTCINFGTHTNPEEPDREWGDWTKTWTAPGRTAGGLSM